MLAPPDVNDIMTLLKQNKKLNIFCQILLICILCLVAFSLGISTSHIVDNASDCSVTFQKATMIQRMKCFNASESDICAGCIHAGLVNLYHIMIR